MGAEVTGILKRPPGEAGRSPDSPAARPDPRPDRPAGNPGTGTPAEPGTRTPERPAGRTEGKEKDVPILAPVSEQAPAPEAPKKKQTRKKTPAKKKQETGFSSEQITALLVSMSSIAAARPGMEVWVLTEVEAKQIADPLANMIAKSEKLSNAGEYADAIALVTACLVVFVPRFIMWSEMNKTKKIEKNGGAVLVKQEGKGNGDNRKPVGKNARPAEVNADSIFAAIPPSI